MIKKEDWKKFVNLFREGKTYMEIAYDTKTSYSNVATRIARLRKMGVDLPPRKSNTKSIFDKSFIKELNESK